MMRRAVRDQLAHLLAEHGQELARDPRRCQAFLRDLCPDDRAEIAVLVAAVDEGVPDQLRATSGPIELSLPRIADQLANARGLSAEAAAWAVASWAHALGIEVLSAPTPTWRDPTEGSGSDPAMGSRPEPIELTSRDPIGGSGSDPTEATDARGEPSPVWWRRPAALLAGATVAILALVGAINSIGDGDTAPDVEADGATTASQPEVSVGGLADEGGEDASDGAAGGTAGDGGDEDTDAVERSWVASDDEVVELSLPPTWQGHGGPSFVEMGPDLDAWRREFDGIDRDVATAAGIRVDVQSVDELALTRFTDDEVRELLYAEAVPSNCAYVGVEPIVRDSLRGFEEMHLCDGGVHRIAALFDPVHDDYVLRYRLFETPEEQLQLEAVRDGVVFRRDVDAILIDRLWRGLDRAWQDGRSAAVEYEVANNYPPLGYSVGQCSVPHLIGEAVRRARELPESSRRYQADRGSVRAVDAYEIPDGRLAGEPVDGQPYKLEVYFSSPRPDSAESTTAYETRYVTVLDERPYFLNVCES